MKRFLHAAAAAGLALGLGACGEAYDEQANEAYADNGADYDANAAAAGTATAATWPEGSRIVVEEGVTYRIDADGTRVALGPADSRIVEEDGVRFRVDPDGTRVRIDDEGLAVDVPDLDAPDPDLDAQTDVDADADVDANVSADVNTPE